MSLTVYAEGMGFFHKGSNGKAVAPGDVCLTPPPPPAGPVPVPYVNVISASDLTKGSKTVKIDGQPTALEDHSYVSTSTGDEPGTQGGNVITHKTKGKGYFEMWSMTVKVEGKGVCRHGDPVGQNCASMPYGTVAFQAITGFKILLAQKGDCPPDSYPGNKGTNAKQKAQVHGGPCYQCGATKSGRKNPKKFTPDHQPTQKAAWYMGGCHDPAGWAAWAKHEDHVVPHCKDCSNTQGGKVSHATIQDLKTKAF